MKKKQLDIAALAALAAFMSKPENFRFVQSATSDKDRKNRIEKLRSEFFAQSGEFSNDNDSWVQTMSAAVEDVGCEEFSFLNDAEFDFAAFNRAAATETGIQTIKRIVATHNVRESVKTYLTSRNDVIRANKAKKSDAKKATKKSNVSSPYGI